MQSVFFLSLMNGSAWGGSEELWYKTALWMAGNNYKVGVCCYNWPEKKEKITTLQQSGCTIYLLPNKNDAKGLFGKWKLHKLVAALPLEQYELHVVNQGGWEEVLHSPYKKLYRRLSNYVLLYHNYNNNAKLSAARQQLLQRWIAGAAKNIFLSGKIMDMLQNNFGIAAANAILYYNPITITPPQQVIAYPPLQNGNYVFVMLAALDVNRKAQDVLIQTLAQSKWKSRNWQLHLYGSGKDEAALMKLIADNSMQDKIALKGFTENVAAVLEQCHWVLQITHIDAMPLTVVEAMAMARPCIVSNVGDMPQWIQHNHNGFVCNTATIPDIDNVLEQCWQQQGQWAAMGQNAFTTFIKKYPQPYEEKMAALLLDNIK
jgi:glycosyltransferase involved in cell wall biosynthesis